MVKVTYSMEQMEDAKKKLTEFAIMGRKAFSVDFDDALWLAVGAIETCIEMKEMDPTDFLRETIQRAVDERLAEEDAEEEHWCHTCAHNESKTLAFGANVACKVADWEQNGGADCAEWEKR